MSVKIVGVDLGSQLTRVALLDPLRKMPLIQRNGLSNEATPSSISLIPGEMRLLGEGAGPKELSRPSCTIGSMSDLVEGTPAAGARLKSRGTNPDLATFDSTAPGFPRVDLGDAGVFDAPQLVGFYLGQVLEYGSIGGAGAVGKLAIACPAFSSQRSRSTLLSAAMINGLKPEQVMIIDDTAAAAAYFHHLQYDNLTTPLSADGATANPTTHAVIVNIGHNNSSALYLAAHQMSVIVQKQVSIPLGSREIDDAIAKMIFEHILTKHKFDVRGHAKSYNKVLRESKKAKEMLSTSDQANVALDALANDIDVQVLIKKSDVEAAIQPFTTAIEKMLEELGVPSEVKSGGKLRVEAIGGGWRAPVLQNTIKKVLECTRVGVTLDSNLAIAEGCAIVAANEYARGLIAAKAAAAATADPAAAAAGTASTEDPQFHPVHAFALTTHDVEVASAIPPPPQDALSAWQGTEGKAKAADDLIRTRQSAKDKLESLVCSTRNILPSCKLDKAEEEKLEKLLDEQEQWIWDDCQEATTEVIDQHTATLKASLEANAKLAAYFEEQREIERKKDEELARLMREQQDEKELKSDPQRLRAAQQRREQGQKLFKEEHWPEAQKRFVNALEILGSLYDTTNEETKQKKHEISLSCHLNIASCSIKLGLWRNAVNNASKALEYDPNNAKALFRRGQGNFKLANFDEATKDLERAKELSGGDAAVVQELAAVRAAIEQEKAKEKKMFSKMFG